MVVLPLDEVIINLSLLTSKLPVTDNVDESVEAPLTPRVPPIVVLPVAWKVPLTSNVRVGASFMIPTPFVGMSAIICDRSLPDASFAPMINFA